VRILLALVAALLLVSVGSGATARTSKPQNGLIAVEGRGIFGGIYIVDPRTETARLIPNSTDLTDPAWSPDGTRLAVTSLDGEVFDVYTMTPDGTDRTLVLRNASYPSWSPDAKQLVVMRETEGKGSSLAIVNTDGTDVRTLVPGGTEEAPNEALHVSAPEWSPDGKLIAFVHKGDSIELITPDGRRVPMPVAASDVASGDVSWSPDSSKLAFDRYDSKVHEVAVVVDLASGHETVLPGEENGAVTPVWSPDGNQLLFSSLDVRPAIAPGLTPQLWVMAPDGTKAAQLVEGEYYGTPSWARRRAAVLAVTESVGRPARR
jgi:Tol biopolymer transport system component